MNKIWLFIFAFLVGAAWSIANILLFIKLLKIAVLKASKAKLTVILLAKFPLLYLAGFLILTLRFFPVEGLLTGMGSIILFAGAIIAWPRHTQLAQNLRIW